MAKKKEGWKPEKGALAHREQRELADPIWLGGYHHSKT